VRFAQEQDDFLASWIFRRESKPLPVASDAHPRYANDNDGAGGVGCADETSSYGGCVFGLFSCHVSREKPERAIASENDKRGPKLAVQLH
jgi:hypothetical protein